MNQPLIAAQMYTVREAAEKDLHQALQQVAELGYTAVELAGLFGLSPRDVAQSLSDLGLKCTSAHVPLSDLENELSKEIETYLELGATYLVCPWLPPELRQDETSYYKLASTLNQIGQRCKDSGLGFCYHHHDFELVRYNGKHALDILLENSAPENLQLEADTYWLEYGGQAPAGYIRRWVGRVPIIHFKDMTATKPHTFAEVGAGFLDWPPILEAARAGHTQYYIV